jgi:galactokinase
MTTDQVTAGDHQRIARDLVATFRRMHGRPPTGCFAAPGRVNLIGEHVDYNDGRCLPMALPHATFAALAAREDRTVTVTSLQQSPPWRGTLDTLGPGQVQGWPSYVTGVAWAMREKGFDLPGMDILVDGRVPVGAGLSSSAALECSVALGMCELAGRDVDAGVRQDLVEACMRAEREVAGVPTGGMDQTVSLLGRAGHALLLDCRDWTTRQVPWDPEGHDLELLVVDTRAYHSLTDGGYESRRRDCERATRALGVSTLRDVADADAALRRLDDDRVRRRVRHVLTEMRRVDRAVRHLEGADYPALGTALTSSHESLRDDYQVSCEELDAVVETSLAHGALGARMTGGGFGGSAIALVPAARSEEVRQAVAAAFAERGWPAPGFLAGTPADGARRVG